MALALCGAAFVSTRDRSVRDAAFNDQGQPFFPDFKDPWPAPTWRSSILTRDGHRLAVPGQVQGRQVGDPVPLRLSGRRQGPALEDGGRRDGPDQGHDPLRPGRGPGRDGRHRPARHQDHHPEGPRQAGHPAKTPPRRSSPTSSSATRSRTRPSQRATCACPARSEPTASRSRPSLSTRFADWIETNLLKLEASQVRKIEFDNYKVNLEQGYQPGEVLDIERKDVKAAMDDGRTARRPRNSTATSCEP